MKHITIATAVIALALSSLTAQERYITLMAQGASVTNSFSIETNETAFLAQLEQPDIYWVMTVRKPYENGSINRTTDGVNGGFGVGYMIAGPATIALRRTSGSSVSGSILVTWKIMPAAFPPDRTLVIPAGTPGAVVTLETSTNLLNWTTATNGFYSGTNTSQFFRINAQRVQ